MTTSKNGSNPDLSIVAQPPAPTNPFDLDALRQMNLGDVETKKTRLAMRIGRPKKDQFFRVHPGDDYWAQGLVIEREEQMDRVLYWVHPALHADLVGSVYAVRVYTCVTKLGAAFLWAARIPSEQGGAGTTWHRTALQAAEIAKSTWVKLVSDRDSGGYNVVEAVGNLGEPKWPTEPLVELIQIAFKGRVIDSVDHDVIRELVGEI